MGICVSSLTILFEDPFWVGLYEREDGRRYEVCKITFGAEPKDYEVYEFLLKHGNRLRFSPPVRVMPKAQKYRNPKRIHRLINQQLENTGIGTKAQRALKVQQEQGKTERKVFSREQREKEKQRQFVLRTKKRKEKHRGH